MKAVLSKARYGIYFSLILFAFFFVVATGNSRETIATYDVNKAKSIEAVHIVNKYSNILEDIKPVFVSNMEEAALKGPNSPIMFTGTMTGYGPDCVGCGGRVGCPPRQDVRNGNIYFNDTFYGKIRIVATDKAIPCGSIVRISNSNLSNEPIIAVALDRGGAIKGNIMDLLLASEAETKSVGRQKNIQFEIIRWGW